MKSSRVILKQAVCCLAVGFVSIVILPAAAQAQKGSKVPPPGTVYFVQGNPSQVWAMNGDGTSRQAIFPSGISGVPSGLVYGSDPQLDRLWLVAVPNGAVYNVYLGNQTGTIPHYDLYCLRRMPGGSVNDYDALQLTDFHGALIVAETMWSGDGQDSFSAFTADDITAAWDEIRQAYNMDAFQRRLFRVDLTGAMLEAAMAAPELWSPFTPLDVACGGSIANLGDCGTAVQWCPDGLRIIFDRGTQSILVDLATGSETILWDEQISRHFRWSPLVAADGEYRLAFVGTSARGKGIHTMRPDGGELRLIIPAEGSLRVPYAPIWSTDNSYLVYGSSRYVPGTYKYYLYRTPATANKPLLLSRGLDEYVRKEPLEWVANMAAP